MRIPIFPLNGAILFPGTNLPLNIFEKKYLQMVDYALSNNRLIGMIQKKENNEFFKIGCLGKITNFSETADGRYQINLEGLERYYFKKTIKTEFKFFIIEGDIIKSKNNLKTKDNINDKLMFSFKKYLKTKKLNFNTSDLSGLDASNLAKIICVISPLNYLLKQMLLELNSEDELCRNLISVLEIEMENTDENLKIN